MKVGIMGNGFSEWGGGIDLLKLLINVIEQDSSLSVTLILKGPSTTRRFRDNIKVHWYGMLGEDFVTYANQINEIKNNFLSEFPSLDIVEYKKTYESLNGVIKRKHVDILFPSIDILPPNIVVPWIGYIYDFQYKYLPHFFSEELCATRNESFKKMLTRSEAVFVNARSVENDINKFFPEHSAKIYVPPFLPLPRKEWLEDNKDLLEKYKLPSRYFIISNQFWKHKDHSTAFRALAKLHKRCKRGDFHIICTGKMEDIRYPDYADELKKLISELNIEKYVHFLGYIPKVDQIEILKHSIAAVQPTLFEGGPGGGIAYDSISLGHRIILSDIPVNREIDSKYAIFFKAGSDDNLAQKMDEAIVSNYVQPAKGELLKIAEDKRDKYCRFLRNMFDDVLHR